MKFENEYKERAYQYWKKCYVASTGNKSRIVELWGIADALAYVIKTDCQSLLNEFAMRYKTEDAKKTEESWKRQEASIFKRNHGWR